MPEKEKVPVFKNWNQWYWLVIWVLAASIVFFYLITRHFS